MNGEGGPMGLEVFNGVAEDPFGTGGQ